jgi:hypothetical protein
MEENHIKNGTCPETDINRSEVNKPSPHTPKSLPKKDGIIFAALFVK